MIVFIPMARPTGRYFGSKSRRRTKDQRRQRCKIGMIGLGRMGANMARRLIRKGHPCVSAQQVTTSGDPNLSRFAGHLSDSGEGRWTIKVAIDEAVPASVLTAALYERFSFSGRGRTLPTSSCPRCSTNSVDIWRSPTANPKSLEATSKKSPSRPRIGPDRPATNYTATSSVGKDKHELADLSTNHRSVPSRFGFSRSYFTVLKLIGDTERGRNTCGGGYREPRP